MVCQGFLVVPHDFKAHTQTCKLGTIFVHAIRKPASCPPMISEKGFVILEPLAFQAL